MKNRRLVSLLIIRKANVDLQFNKDMRFRSEDGK
jgi:hypothetical protein